MYLATQPAEGLEVEELMKALVGMMAMFTLITITSVITQILINDAHAAAPYLGRNSAHYSIVYYTCIGTLHMPINHPMLSF